MAARYQAGASIAAPNSSGAAPPGTKAPLNAADCHIHIYDPRFAPPVDRVANGTATDYRLFQKRIGLARVVIVQPRNYGVDNSATLDAIAQFGIDTARGVAVLHPDVSDAVLKRLDAGGIRGIRFTTADPRTAVVSPAMIQPLAKRVAAFGWHIQLNMPVEHIVEYADVLRRIPSPVVFDHLGMPGSMEHPAYKVIRELLDARKAWLKLSGANFNSEIGPPDYPEATPIAQSYVKAAPERLVWGSDWPHPGMRIKPDGARLFDLLAVWAPDESTRNRILVQNAEDLYGFPRAGS